MCSWFDTSTHDRWFGTNLGEKGTSALGKRGLSTSLVGRYMQDGQEAAPATLSEDFFADAPVPAAKKSKRQGGGFGGFEGW